MVFVACGEGTETLVFDTPQAAVVYLGDLAFDDSGKELRISHDIERARKHVDQHFPALKGRVLEQRKFRLRPVARGCLPTEMMMLKK